LLRVIAQQRLARRRVLVHLQRLAVRAQAAERIGTAGAALVDQEHIALLAHLAQRGIDDDRHFTGRLAGAAGEEEHRVRLAVAAVIRFQPGNAQVDLAALGMGAVLGHLQRAALGFHVGAGADRGQRARTELDRPVALARRVVAVGGTGSGCTAAGKHRAGKQHAGRSPGQSEMVFLHRA